MSDQTTLHYRTPSTSRRTTEKRSSVPASQADPNSPSDFPPSERIQDHEIPLTEHEMQELERNFRPPKQLIKLLLNGFLRWMITLILSGGMAGIMYYYSTFVNPMSETDKKIYNFLVVGMSLALGMNLASSLKTMATNMRWWILSLKERRLREVDLILHMDSLTEILKLAFIAPRLAPACISWLLLNVLAQLGIAVLGLYYSPDSISAFALLKNGTVYVPDMSEFYSEAHNDSNSLDTPQDQEYTANSFGTISLNYYSGTIADIPPAGALWQPNSPTLFQGDNWWQYIFLDRNPENWNDFSDASPALAFTNRAVLVNHTCNSWTVREGGSGVSHNITISLDSKNGTLPITIPYAGGPGQTTFITDPRGSNCGDRCSTVWALEASLLKPWWYECNITISDVSNATNPEHHLDFLVSKRGAAAIALQGHIPDLAQARVSQQGNHSQQYQTYPATSLFGATHAGITDDMGMIISRFSVGVIAVATDWNKLLLIGGSKPEVGSALVVNWNFIIIILGITVGLQFFLFIICGVVANRVIVKDDSYLATARLLRPIVERLGPMGTYADGKEISKLLSKDKDQEKVVYSVKHSQGNIPHYLDLGRQERLRAFPEGHYA